MITLHPTLNTEHLRTFDQDAIAVSFARRTAPDKYREMYDLARQAQIVTISALPRRQSVTP